MRTALSRLGLALLLSVPIATVERVATAAPSSVSPFAGTYSGSVPGTNSRWWVVSVSSSGRVTGTGFTANQITPAIYETGHLSGRVSTDGRMTLSGSETFSFMPSKFRLNASVALDANGNLSGVTDAGAGFYWSRS